MNIGDRVRTPAGDGTIVRFHYEPMSLGVRNVRRLAFIIVETDDHTRHVFPPRDITKEEPMPNTNITIGDGVTVESTTIEPDPQPQPDPTPPQPEPVEDGDDTEKLIEWP